MKISLQCHIVEQTGHGVPKIVKRYGASAYDFGTSTITVAIPFDRSGFQNATVKATANATVKLTKTELAILDSISTHGNVIIDELSEITGKHRTTIIRALKQMKEKGVIERVSSDKTGHWEIKE